MSGVSTEYESGTVLEDEEHTHSEGEFLRLARAAQRGELSVVPELREWLSSHPEVWQKYGNLADQAVNVLVTLITGTDLLAAEALRIQIQELKSSLIGEAATPIQKLLAERVLVGWLDVNYAELAVAQTQEADISHAKFAQQRLNDAQKRYLSALQMLETVQKLNKKGKR